MKKIPYRGHYPGAGRYLIDENMATLPRQVEKTFRKSEGVDIIWPLRNMTPSNFRKYSDALLLLAFQEAMRYNEYKWKFAAFEVRLGRLKRGRDLPEVITFQTAMHDDPEIMVWGPGYEVPQRHFLYNKVEDILDLTKRYPNMLRTQVPYRVLRLVISIREMH
jgi:hypothetical protein